MNLDQLFERARSFDDALDVLAEEVGTLGFDAVDYAYMPQVRTHDGGWIAADVTARNFPARWQRGYARVGHNDPYLCGCYQRNLPLDWQEVRSASWLTGAHKQALAFIDGIGFSDGVTVPIHLPGGHFAFVSGLSGSLGNSWRTQETAAKERLFLLAHGFHGAVARRFADACVPAGPPLLSPRERECLRYAAAGYSAAGTAEAICRSLETVRRQRKSAMRKLDARSMVQAVARASTLGLLARATG
jgi:LuxR family transcriptional regulator